VLNVAIALAFLLSALFAPGQNLLTSLLGAPALQSLPIAQQVLVVALAGYWLPALLIYLFLATVPVAARFKPSRGEAMVLGLSNTVQVAYVCVRAYSFTVPGGGIGLLVSMAAPFTAWPALAVNAIVLSMVAIRRFGSKRLSHASDDSGRKEGLRWPQRTTVVTIAVGFVPVLYAAAILFIGETSPFQLAQTSAARMNELCDSAGERIHRVLGNVEGLYWDYVGGVYFGVPDVRFEPKYRGTYTSWGGGADGEAYANSPRIQFVEAPYRPHKTNEVKKSRYVRYFKGRKNEYVDELSATIGVFRNKLTSDEDEKRGLEGYEVTVRVLDTGEVTAENRFFFNRKTKQLCGRVEHNSFSDTSFLVRAFGW